MERILVASRTLGIVTVFRSNTLQVQQLGFIIGKLAATMFYLPSTLLPMNIHTYVVLT